MGRRALVGAALALALVGAGCGGDDGDDLSDDEKDRLVEAMVAEGADEDEARCLVDELGEDGARLFGADESDLSEDDTAKLLDALNSCRAG